jgi:S1-C subfamily serine protease
VNLFDVVVLGATGLAALGGWRLGFLARVASWIGLALGIYVAARFLPAIVRAAAMSDASSRLLLAAIVLLGGAFVGQAVGQLAGIQLHRVLPVGGVRTFDRGAGAAIGAVGLFVALWLLLPSIADVPGWPSQSARNSTIARWIDRKFPRPPNTLQVLRRLVGNDAFPQVFSALGPSFDSGPPPAASGLSTAVQNAVTASTVKVVGEACGRIQEGSGFAVRADLVVTNAHVVAGEGRGRTGVLLPSSSVQLPATVLLFDPDRDLALLHVSRLGEAPLAIGAGQVGETGAVFGHPEGVDRVVIAPAAIRQNVEAVGRDLYDSHVTRRDVFILASELHPGDSGGPLVDPRGTVVGVAFAVAPDRPGTSYALTTKELAPVLGQPLGAPVGTGGCLTE